MSRHLFQGCYLKRGLSASNLGVAMQEAPTIIQVNVKCFKIEKFTSKECLDRSINPVRSFINIECRVVVVISVVADHG
jgi:hypothetical protein